LLPPQLKLRGKGGVALSKNGEEREISTKEEKGKETMVGGSWHKR